MKILVTGGCGFLGSYVVDELESRGHEVVVFDRQPSSWLPKGRVFVGDILNQSAVAEAIEGCDAVYHFAGLADLNKSIRSPVETVSLNIQGTVNVLEAAVAHRIGRFVFASSAYVFSQKGGFYGVSKKAAELLIEEYAKHYPIEYTIIRYGSVYGERADATNRIYRIIRQALIENRIDFPGDGTEEREYIHGRDAARLSADILDSKYRNSHVVLTGVERLSYSDLLLFIKEIMNNKIKISFGDSEYQGHYVRTPYSFSPTVGVKVVANPCVDFGQGILECIETLHHEISIENELKK